MQTCVGCDLRFVAALLGMIACICSRKAEVLLVGATGAHRVRRTARNRILPPETCTDRGFFLYANDHHLILNVRISASRRPSSCNFCTYSPCGTTSEYYDS